MEAARALQARSGHTVIVKRGKNGSFGRNEHEEVNVDAFNVLPADASAPRGRQRWLPRRTVEGASLEEERMCGGGRRPRRFISAAVATVTRCRSEVAALLGDCAHVPPTKCVPIDEGR